uniref:SAC3/GANP/THP3 conserved domain-containing protein n=1 Tax=Chlamydomonas euryale TaxID=1486919 RepID=A0A7R9V2P4_9CHLO
MGKNKWVAVQHAGAPGKKQKQQHNQWQVQAAAQTSDDADDRREAMLMKAMSQLEKTGDPERRAKLEAKIQRLLASIRASVAANTAAQRTSGGAGSSGFIFRDTVTPNHANVISKGVKLTAEELRRRQQRAQRFEDDEAATSDPDASVLLRQRGLGTSMALEKEYLRLTSLPSASSVRPPNVLALALDLVKARWRERSDYKHACEQLKSIRQDLTVQHVRSLLTVDAYETHSRIALEVGDLAEFKQCHSVLKTLYADGVQGQREEFLAYGLLFAQSTGKGSLFVSALPSDNADMAHPTVAHALAVCRAFRMGDFHAFSSLYSSAPRMSPYLMDRMLPKMRAFACQAIMTAYRPTPVPLSYLEDSLAVQQDGADAANIVVDQGGVVDTEAGVLDTRASRPRPAGSARPP